MTLTLLSSCGIFCLEHTQQRNLCPMKNQSLHEGVGPFLALELGVEITHQWTSNNSVDFEFKPNPEKQIFGTHMKDALQKYYSPSKGNQLSALDEHSGMGSLIDGVNISHSVAFSIYTGSIRLTIEEI